MRVSTLEIDGRTVTGAPGETVFDAAWNSGIRIPRLCHLGSVSDVGACRLCLVEIEGQSRLQPACMTPVREGMVVRAHTPAEGGIFTSFDLATGEVFKQARIAGALGDYFASPVGADGNIYLTGENGKAAVLQAGAQWEVRRVNDLGDGSKSTPAIVDGKMYFRTYSTLYCFAKKD